MSVKTRYIFGYIEKIIITGKVYFSLLEKILASEKLSRNIPHVSLFIEIYFLNSTVRE